MSRADTMLSYIPAFLRSSKVMQAILSSSGAEIDMILAGLDDILASFYVQTASETGLKRWESMLDIKRAEGKSINERRSAIIARLRAVGTVTAALIQSVAESFILGTVAVVEKSYAYAFDTYRETDHPPYTINIHFIDVMGIPANIDDCKAAISAIIPAHISVNYVFNYLTWNMLEAQGLTWDELGALNLSWTEFESGTWITS